MNEITTNQKHCTATGDNAYQQDIVSFHCE